MIITMERLAHFPGAAASRPRAASFSFPSRLRTPVLSGARSRLVPRAALTSWAAGAASFPPRGFPNYIHFLVALSCGRLRSLLF